MRDGNLGGMHERRSKVYEQERQHGDQFHFDIDAGVETEQIEKKVWPAWDTEGV